MGVAAKTIQVDNKSVSRQEFEEAFLKLMECTRIIDQKVSRKADEAAGALASKQQKRLQALQLSFDQLKIQRAQ
ncbi:hypothetical protein [Radiobacillus sp. PE A8.2]|uniref:hypothetical protein n=1 Tax=Radiobacillus sp. PE A8.2 TaxID=3380349 RepID=UPI00388DC239